MPAQAANLMPARAPNLMPARAANLMPARAANLMPAREANLMPAREANLMPPRGPNVWPARAADLWQVRAHIHVSPRVANLVQARINNELAERAATLRARAAKRMQALMVNLPPAPAVNPPPAPAVNPPPAPAVNPPPPRRPAPLYLPAKRPAFGLEGAESKRNRTSDPGEGPSDRSNSRVRNRPWLDEAEKDIPIILDDNKNNCKYQRIRFIGKGGFGICYKIREMATDKTFAAKVIAKKMLTKVTLKKALKREIEIHRPLTHKHVVGFHNSFEDMKNIYIILEYCSSRSLLDLQIKRHTLTVPECRYFIYEVLQGVLFLHQRKIIHRDLKPGNIFLNDQLHIKIGDFGLATKFNAKDDRTQTFCGTPNYMAPEMMSARGHSFKADIWSIGCILYSLIVGTPPFDGALVENTYTNIRSCIYKIPLSVHEEAASLIKMAVQRSPGRRPSVDKMLKHEFIHSSFRPISLPRCCFYTSPKINELDFVKIDEPRKNKPNPGPPAKKNERGRKKYKCDANSTYRTTWCGL
ncbi:serine/threonine-protein kinase polo [Spodoptera frugiperda]|uniref:Serine/threonine-protein kinase polo n=1 Tax=Spodoptera frugiperda TaxID=7108 RepID=A0A9R0CYX6_SPOFR|nr:serine/threonine-protein kinase polo [Spodoptera frugiperda]